MSQLSTVEEILEFAIQTGQDAIAPYTDLADQAKPDSNVLTEN